jgi:hypothetical protein
LSAGPPPARCSFFASEGLLLEEQGASVAEHLAGCLDCREDQRQMAALRAELGRLAAPASAPHWEQAVFASIAAAESQPRRRPWWIAVPLVTGALVLALFLTRRGAPPPAAPAPLLAMQFEAGAERLRGEEQPTVGGLVSLRATGLAGAHRELRIYRDDAGLALRCSDQPPCLPQGDGLSARWQIPALGRYRVVVVTGPAPPPASGGSYQGDQAALRALPAVTTVEGLFEVW